MAPRLNKKVAVITGGTRGLGRAIAETYARAGAAVVVASRSASSVAETVADLRAQGYRAEGISCDVGDIQQVRALADVARMTFGGIDIWVNNAGVAGVFGPTLDIPRAQYRQVIDTNILGTYNGSTVALEHLRGRGRGKLINLVGRGDRKPAPLQNAYGPSKAWVRNFTLGLAAEYPAREVGIFAFNPGLVITDLLTDVDVVSGYEERVRGLDKVIKLWGEPPEVPARKALWLASSATDGRTGLAVTLLTRRRLAGGILRAGLRALLRRPAVAPPVRPHVVA
ncbi:SDR family oxidoreductase [Chloroflexales bacterium ZM16-3]|nr:SDR family oxidoreductase [Chloroflexales bacterium ZM16-3]